MRAELELVVSAALLGEDMEFIEGPLTMTLDLEEGVMSSVSKNLSSKALDMRGYLVMPPLANMHVHALDYAISEEGWDLDIDSLVGEPHGLKYILLRKRWGELRQWLIRFLQDARSFGSGYVGEFREFGLMGLRLGKIGPGHYVFGMPEPGSLTEEKLRNLTRSSDGIGISSPLYFSDSELKEIFRVARIYGKGVLSHVSEVKETHDEGDFRKLISLGKPSGVIHGVWLGRDELSVLADERITLILCLRSNLWFLSGIPRLRDVYDLGISVAVGSDNGGWVKPDLWREGELLYFLLRKAGRDDPEWVMKALTNASLLGVRNYVGEGSGLSFLLLKYGGTAIERARNKHVALIKRGGEELVDCLVVNGDVLKCRGKATALCNSLRNDVS